MIIACVLALMLAQPEWIGPPAVVFHGEPPSWVWATTAAGVPTREDAPVGAVWIGREFDIPEGGVEAEICVAADNAAELFVDGRRMVVSKSWSSPSRGKVSLVEGRHTVAVRAVNDAGTGRNPAGVLVRMSDAKGSGWVLNSDGSWKGGDSEWKGWPASPPPGELAAVTVLGPSTSPPWSVAVSAFVPLRPCPVLRREFELASVPKRATVRIVGLGHYELSCNGAPVGESLINQAWSQFNRTLYWQEFDLTPHLRAGGNALGVQLGNSFWSVGQANDSGRFTKTDCMPDFSNGREHLLWLKARIDLSEGERVVVSDGEWKWDESPLTFSNVFAGEDYDARRVQRGWNRPGFDASAWKPVDIAMTPEGVLAPLVGPRMRAFERFRPVETIRIDESTTTFVFEQNCTALLRFKLEGAAGASVRFRPCEYKQADGRVKFTYTWGTGKDIWFDYTLRGGAEDGSGRVEEHQTKFCFVGAQYVQVDGAAMPGEPNPRGLPVLHELELVHVRAACPVVGTFTCSDPMQNAAFRMIDWSIRSNMAHFPMDCPHREKCSWLEQDWHMARALSYRFDIREWYRKLCRDIRDTQLPDGHVPTNSPNYLVGVPPHGFWNEAAEWGIASVLVPWHIYEWYGDEAILRESYKSMKSFVNYLETKAKADGGLLKSNLGDWYDYGHGKGDGPSRWTPSEVSAMAVWAIGAKTVADTAAILGRGVPVDQHGLNRWKLDEARYITMRENIKAVFQEKLYDAATRTVKNNGSCQAGNAAALCADLIPAEHREEALQRIVEDVEKRNYQQTVGEVMQVFFVRALAEGGRNDVLHRVYARRDRGGYGYMVEQGLTTLPESWDARPGTHNSMNHFMLGHLMEWHFAYVAGIRQAPGSVGWEKVVIGPNPSPKDDEQGLTSAEASFASPRGRIHVSWKAHGGTLHIDMETPTEAELIVPGGTRKVVPAGRSTHAFAMP